MINFSLIAYASYLNILINGYLVTNKYIIGVLLYFLITLF